MSAPGPRRPAVLAPPSVPGVITAEQVARTAQHIADQQQPSGLIPWFPGHHADPWDHVEAAMALASAGHLDASRAALGWLARNQRPDGSWPMKVLAVDGHETVVAADTDLNQCAYVAVGALHHLGRSGDISVVADLWPTVVAAIDLVVAAQRGDGAIGWCRTVAGRTDPMSLLAGSSSIAASLRAASALGELLGDPRPDWELAREDLVAAITDHVAGRRRPFADRSRYSMDWYYPVLGGAVTGTAADRLIDSRWSEFVVPGWGIRCVADRPWATPAESCELVITLTAMGRRAQAAAILRDVQAHRDPDGGYWTGYVWPDEAIWPPEQTTWTAAAVILAAEALDPAGPGSALVDLARGRS